MDELEQRIVRLWRPLVAGRIGSVVNGTLAIQGMAEAKPFEPRQVGILFEGRLPPSRDGAIIALDPLLSTRLGVCARVVRP